MWNPSVTSSFGRKDILLLEQEHTEVRKSQSTERNLNPLFMPIRWTEAMK